MLIGERPSAGVGFRHVIEDGLSILSNRNIDPGRREYVLTELASLMRKASKASKLIGDTALFVGSDEKNAYESYSLLGRYLSKKHEEDFHTLLATGETAFERLQSNQNIDEDTRSAAVTLLEDLLSSLERETIKETPLRRDETRSGA